MRIWAYHTPVTTNTSQRCTVIQHIYSTSHLGTGKNTFTPSLFTAKVAQSDPKRVKRTHKQKNNTLHAVSETSVSNTPATALYMPLCTLWNIDTNCLHRGIEILVCHRAAYCIHFFSVMANLHYKSCMWEPVWGEHKTGLFIIQCEGFCTLDCTALQCWLPKSRCIYNANETSSVQSAEQMHWLDACGFAWGDKSIFFAPLERAHFQHCPCTNATTTLRPSSKLDAMQV